MLSRASNCLQNPCFTQSVNINPALSRQPIIKRGFACNLQQVPSSVLPFFFLLFSTFLPLSHPNILISTFHLHQHQHQHQIIASTSLLRFTKAIIHWNNDRRHGSSQAQGERGSSSDRTSSLLQYLPNRACSLPLFIGASPDAV